MDRVEREKVAHDAGNDVLGRSWALKRRFGHTLDNPARNRLSQRFFEILQSQSDGDVLDFGCGKGEYALLAASAGARVQGIDISPSYVAEASDLIARSGPLPGQASFRVMDAHKLDFADDTFDLIIGNGILHHLDVPIALDEVRRVLKPGGIAVFQEPLGGNPLLKLFRRLTPKARTEDERPFFARDLRRMKKNWTVESEYFGLFCAPLAVVTSVLIPSKPDNALAKLAFAGERLATSLGAFNSWHQYVLLILRKPNGADSGR